MILMYHKVDVVTPTDWWVTPGDLRRHLDLLRSQRIVNLDDYDDPETQVVITFDDAYENLARHALPALRAAGAPFEVFVIGDAIAGWNDFDPREPRTRHMGLEDLDSCVAAGGRLQWHTRTHPDLATLESIEQEWEMTVPEELSARFPEPHFRWFSYPYGSVDERAVDVARSRFAGAVSVFDGRPDLRWQLTRVTVDRDTQLPRLPAETIGALQASIASLRDQSSN